MADPFKVMRNYPDDVADMAIKAAEELMEKTQADLGLSPRSAPPTSSPLC